MLVSFPPGGSSDLVARLSRQVMSETLGQPIVVDNRPGGGGSIAAVALQREAPDATRSCSRTSRRSRSRRRRCARCPTTRCATSPLSPTSAACIWCWSRHRAPASPRSRGSSSGPSASPGGSNYGSSGQGSWSQRGRRVLQAQGRHRHRARALSRLGADAAGLPRVARTLELYFDSLPQNLPSIRAGEGRGLAVSSDGRLSIAPRTAELPRTGPRHRRRELARRTGPAGLPAPVVATHRRGGEGRDLEAAGADPVRAMGRDPSSDVAGGVFGVCRGETGGLASDDHRGPGPSKARSRPHAHRRRLRRTHR